MEEGRRIGKRTVISLVYLAILILLGLGVYSCAKPKATCRDGIKNQNEEDVDCGGVCSPCQRMDVKPLLPGEAGFVGGGAADIYDIYAQVKNPNNSFGSRSFDYEFEIRDADGKIVGRGNGSGFMLPGEEKYVIENGVRMAGVPSEVIFSIKDSRWVEFDQYYEKPRLNIVNKTYSEITSGPGFAEAKGLLKNESPFNLSLIRVQAILKDGEGRVVGLNSSEMRTVKSGEEREIKMAWPSRFSGNVQNVEFQAEVDVFDPDSQYKQYFKAEKFQQFDTE